MVFTLFEIADIAIMTLIVGYLFKDMFRVPVAHTDILDFYKVKPGFWNRNWNDIAWAALLIAPSILIHELGHKFTAMSFGLNATFHAACSSSSLLTGGFLGFPCNLQLLAVAMKYMGVGFVIFVPAFVQISGPSTNLQLAITSFMGPAVHLVFWLGSMQILKNKKLVSKWPKRKQMYVFFFQKINMILFFFNMIPFPGFDGYWVVTNLLKAFT